MLLFRLTHEEYFSYMNVRDNPEYADVLNMYNNKNNNDKNQLNNNTMRSENDNVDTNHNNNNGSDNNNNNNTQQQQQKYYYIYAHIVHLRPRGYIPTIVFIDAMTLTQLAILPFEVNNLQNISGESYIGRGRGYHPHQ